MAKLIFAAGIISLLAACSSTPSGTSTMGASAGMQPGTMQNGSGPRGASGGGPN